MCLQTDDLTAISKMPPPKETHHKPLCMAVFVHIDSSIKPLQKGKPARFAPRPDGKAIDGDAAKEMALASAFCTRKKGPARTYRIL